MERLTMRDVGGRAFWISPQSPSGGYRLSGDADDLRRLDRLAAYEDTGLEPEEVSEYQRLCDSYVKAGLDAKFVQFCIDATQNGLSMDRIRELAQAEKDGRLAVLPCKKGDTIWSYYDYPTRGISRIVVTAVFTLDGITVINTDNYGELSAKDIGDTVFLTRAEAEAALKTRE